MPAPKSPEFRRRVQLARLQEKPISQRRISASPSPVCAVG